MIEQLKSFWRYYAMSQAVEIESRYDVPQSLSQLLESGGQGGVRIWKKRNGKLTSCGRQWVRSNMMPVFEGWLEERGGRAVLRGKIEIDAGVRLAIGFFCVGVFFFFPLFGATSSVVGYLAPVVFLTILISNYLLGKDDAVRMTDHFKHVLNQGKRVELVSD